MGKKTEVVLASLDKAHVLDVDGALSYYAPDAVYRFGNFPAVTGVEAIRKNLYDTHVDIMKELHAEVVQTWESGDSVIVEMIVRITRTDDKIIEMPCVDVVRLNDKDQIKDLRVYMDMAPFFQGIELPNMPGAR
jgi:ketosteroid isomerase-like protein